MHEVRGQDFTLAVKVLLNVTHAPGLTCDLWKIRDLTGWRHTQINVKSDLNFIALAQLHFCLAYKNSHWISIDCDTPVILQLAKDKLSISLITSESWPKTSNVLIKSRFSNCSLVFDAPCISGLLPYLFGVQNPHFLEKFLCFLFSCVYLVITPLIHWWFVAGFDEKMSQFI